MNGFVIVIAAPTAIKIFHALVLWLEVFVIARVYVMILTMKLTMT
jgi:hypothetical protein